MKPSIFELEDPFVPNHEAAQFAGYEVNTWNKNRSLQMKKPAEYRDSRYFIPYYKIGGRVYYKRSDLLHHIEANRVS